MKRRWKLWLGLVLLLVAGAAFMYPSIYWPVTGWAKGEAFYQGRPTSWWRGKLVSSLSQPGGRSVLNSWLGMIHKPWGLEVDAFEEVFLALVSDPSAVPVLIALLEDPDTWVVYQAISMLREMKGDAGIAAKQAVPELIVLGKSQKGNENVGVPGMWTRPLREWVRETVKAIDPEAAVQAGIE